MTHAIPMYTAWVMCQCASHLSLSGCHQKSRLLTVITSLHQIPATHPG